MYVCVCNALREETVIEAAKEMQGRTASVYECFGVTPQCGKCAASLRAMLRRAGAEPAPMEP